MPSERAINVLKLRSASPVINNLRYQKNNYENVKQYTKFCMPLPSAVMAQLISIAK